MPSGWARVVLPPPEEAVAFARGENRSGDPDHGLSNIDHFSCAFVGAEGTGWMTEICKELYDRPSINWLGRWHLGIGGKSVKMVVL
jgi:hypothetical protein